MVLFISRNLADMKTINRYFLFIIVNMSFLMASAQGRLMTIAEVDSIVAQHNLQLEASRLEMDAAEGQFVQARKRENPEVQLMHNVQNPMNRRWFDMGYDGQTDVKLSQPIAIGGQYKNKVRQARATLNATKVAHEAEVQNVRHEARVAFIDLYYTQQKLKVYDKEMASVEKISTACGEQAEKADALSRIALNGEWDKNGSVGHNFFAVGATVSVPLWNRNQGNIRSAKAQYVQATIERQ